MAASSLGDVVDVLVAAGLASSKGDARRTLDGNGYRCNGEVLDTESDLAAAARLHGRYLLLQRGKKSHHLVRVSG